jgi:hypothetical protein
MNTRYTIKLIDIRCNAARKLGGDTISILLAGRKVWVSSDIQFHPQHFHYLNFEDRTICTKDGAENLPHHASICPTIQIESLPAVLKIQTTTFLNFNETIGRAVITPNAAQSKVVHQRIGTDGAEYCVSYNITASY